MSDGTWITLISLAVTFLFMLGTPVLLIIFYWVVGCSFVMDLTLDNTGAELLNVFNKGFALLAMPLFILTGDLINKSGIARRLSDFAYACLGWLRGGLAMAAIGACGLFAAISGSNSATTATIGSMLHPEMVKGGYDERFAAATAAAGGTVGIIIPPSIIFIVYGFLMNLPISDLFVAGIVPGALMVLAMMFAAFTVCTINGWGYLIPLQLSRILKTAFGAWLGFFAIGLVLWCIYTGKASPTEAAGVTVGFCVFVGLLCYPLNKIMGSDKDIPVEKKARNDELKEILGLLSEFKYTPNQARNKFNTVQRKRRDTFRKGSRKARDMFSKQERKDRDTFLKDLAITLFKITLLQIVIQCGFTRDF